MTDHLTVAERSASMGRIRSSRSLSTERLQETLCKYNNRAIESDKIVEELIAMASDFIAAVQRDEELGLSPGEIAFYAALADRPEVLRAMGDETLKKLAVELTEKLRSSTTVDWQVRERVRATMRLLIKRLLRNYQYPPGGPGGGGGPGHRAGRAVKKLFHKRRGLLLKWGGHSCLPFGRSPKSLVITLPLRVNGRLTARPTQAMRAVKWALSGVWSR